MKAVVLRDDLREADIRPEPLYAEYKAILENESRRIFDGSIRIENRELLPFDCPNCGKAPVAEFERWGAQYCRCATCASLLVSPRPGQEALDAFRRESRAGRFWEQTFAAATGAAREHGIFRPRLQWLLSIKDRYGPRASVVADYRSKYPTFLEALCDSGEFPQVVSLQPEAPWEKLPLAVRPERRAGPEALLHRTDILTLFEVIERVSNPGEVLHLARELCAPGGVLVLTTTSSSGFEYQLLGGSAPNLNPLDRMNLFSIDALTRLIGKAGFEILELSTPGRLDVATVRKTLESDPDLPGLSFWRYFFRHCGEDAEHTLQEFLQQYRLSSHVRVVARRQ
ncbi:MAG: methyltransferase domain-containing protein [Acidobacteria bacterium]|nr:methyltransferase domain-containing protein [Acidobacteriota bacterium]